MPSLPVPRPHITNIAVGDIDDGVFDNLDGLIELKLPYEGIGFDPSEAFEKIRNWQPNELYNESSKAWNSPFHAKSLSFGNYTARLSFVNGVSHFLNEICEVVAPVGGELRRGKSTRLYQVFPSSTQRPYLALVNCDKDDSSKQQHLAVIEFDYEPDWDRIVLTRLAHRTQRIFKKQPDRRFVLTAVMSHCTMFIAVFNRAGLFTSHSFDINKDPERFIRIIVGLFTADRKTLGFDSTMFYTRVGEDPCERFLVINGKRYTILDLLYTEQVIRGRGTACLKVRDCEDESRTLVVKDAWVFSNAPLSEAAILEKLKTVEGISKLEAVEHMKVENTLGELVPDATYCDLYQLRGVVADKTLDSHCKLFDCRHHVRILLSPCGSPLVSFRSLRELTVALNDVVDVIEALNGRGYLHRDISKGNIILVDNTKGAWPCRPERSAVLIDFDLATEKTDSAVVRWQVGTIPYMAIELLQSSVPVKHRYYHDLESVFYVLVHICCNYSGPNYSNRLGFNVKATPLGEWSDEEGKSDETESEILWRAGFRKESDTKTEEVFRDHILSNVHPYFEPLKPCLEQLRRQVCDLNKKVFIAKPCGETGIVRRVEMREADYLDNSVEIFSKFRQVLLDAYSGLPATPEGHVADSDTSTESLARELEALTVAPVDAIGEDAPQALLDTNHVLPIPPRSSSGDTGGDPAVLTEAVKNVETNQNRLGEANAVVSNSVPEEVTYSTEDTDKFTSHHDRSRAPYANITNAIDLSVPRSSVARPHTAKARRRSDRVQNVLTSNENQGVGAGAL